jgi:HEAT repeat protein
MKLTAMLAWLCLLFPAAGLGNQPGFGGEDERAQPVPEGAAAGMELPARARIGDAIKGRFIIANTGTKAFRISTGGDYRGSGVPLRLKVRVTDATGKVLPDKTEGLPCFGGLGGSTEIAPGKSHEIQCPFQAYVAFTHAGTYMVEAWHDLGWKADAAHPLPVAKTKIEIVLPSPDEAAGRVRELCAADNADVQWQLSKLQHPVFLPSLVSEANGGRANALFGIGGIETTEATEVLVKLLSHSSGAIVKAAAQRLTNRLPSLEDAAKPAFHNMFDGTSRAALLKSWDPKFRALLLEAADRLLHSADTETVSLGAWFITAQGDAEIAPALIAALQRSLETRWEIRAGKDANVLDFPAPLHALIGAVDALRARGWRTDGLGGSAVILANFRQVADPKMPRPADDRWKQSVIAFMDANPPTFRENAVRAIPAPMPDEFMTPLLKALDDEDWGVVRAACEVAGKSGRKDFIPALAQIVETMHATFVQSAAHDAAFALGARVELWAAWCEVITDKDKMYDAVSHLLLGAIDLPPSSGGGGNSNFTREQRFAIRDAWRGFLAKHRAILGKGGRVPMDDPSITPLLIGANFNPDQPAVEIHLKDGTSWPPRPRKSQ